jgi:hypothetical protein
MIALKKRPRTQSAATIAHTATMAAKINRKRTDRKTEGVFGEDQFGFIRGKGLGMQLGC